MGWLGVLHPRSSALVLSWVLEIAGSEPGRTSSREYFHSEFAALGDKAPCDPSLLADIEEMAGQVDYGNGADGGRKNAGRFANRSLTVVCIFAAILGAMEAAWTHSGDFRGPQRWWGHQVQGPLAKANGRPYSEKGGYRYLICEYVDHAHSCSKVKTTH